MEHDQIPRTVLHRRFYDLAAAGMAGTGAKPSTSLISYQWLSFYFVKLLSLPLPLSLSLSLSICMAAGGSKVNEVRALELGGRLDFGKMGYGCKHYRRRCRIRAPCCNVLFACRHCHNESTDDRHELPRHEVQRVICLICDTEQPAEKACLNCGVNMGEYFCSVCKFYDDTIDKKHYHCDHCGICRVGGRENFFHCQKCGCCYSRQILNRHVCVENSLRHNCPFCYEYLFDSLKVSSVLQCGHTLHSDCLMQMRQHQRYTCPICSKVIDVFRTRKELENELMESTAAPEDFRHRKAWILCNDCKDTTEVPYHAAIGVKCIHCYSYNTRKIAPHLPQ